MKRRTRSGRGQALSTRPRASTEARLRLASIVESSDDAIIAAKIDGTITDWNQGAELLFGYSASEMIGNSLLSLIPQDTPGRLRALFRDLRKVARTNRYDCSFKRKAKDGTNFLAAVRVSPIFDDRGKICGGSVIIRDITFRKHQEAMLRESETRFRLVADTAPVLIWMSGTDKLCTYFNKGWLEFTGRSLKSQLGNGWAKGVHPDDLESCVSTYSECFDRRQKFRLEYRLRRHDGAYRWVVDWGVPRFDADAAFAGYIGSCIDVTEIKTAEQAMSNLSHRLIEQQEKERARISRDLHDDIGQRLSLLAVELEQFGNAFSKMVPGAGRKIHEMGDQIDQIITDTHALSHGMHSSKLESLGMVQAMKGFCREFAELQKAVIDFQSDNLQTPVQPDISLCLFRVLQEALSNAAKHSGGRSFQVRTWEAGDCFHLTVSDFGSGFDARETAGGLGLISMRERLKQLNGELLISSKRKVGTTVHARVPRKIRTDTMRIAG